MDEPVHRNPDLRERRLLTPGRDDDDEPGATSSTGTGDEPVDRSPATATAGAVEAADATGTRDTGTTATTATTAAGLPGVGRRSDTSSTDGAYRTT